MERTLSRTVPIPILAALTVALTTTLALVIVAALMLQIDTTARELAAAQQAEREFADLAKKLPGLTQDPEIAGMGRMALAELGAISSETGQDRIVAVRGGGSAAASWPQNLTVFSENYVRFDGDENSYAGVQRTLGDRSEVLVAYPVASTGPLTSAFLRWGLVIAAVIVVIAALVALITGVAISRRIAKLNALCERVEAGEVTARHPVSTTDEIGTLGSHMNTMLDELQRRLEALRDTADGLAHDLRTPLARVQGRLSRLEEMVTSDRASAEVRLAGEELARLMDAFNALLELREIETQGVLSVDKFPVEKAVADAVELYEAVAEEDHHVQIVCDLQPCEAMGNAPLIVRATANLIDNALKVSPDGGTIHVSVVCQPDNVEIVVQDQGAGLGHLPAGHRSSLGGHGIGLRIVRAVARQHGGSFSLGNVEPDHGSGARAVLILPLRGFRKVS